MKTILKIFLLLLITVPALAQDDDPELIEKDPKAQERIRAAHAAYITERLGLTADEAEKFWPVYREYTQKRRAVRQQLREARKKGTDEKELLELELKIKQQELDLEKEYSGRLQTIITPQKMLKLRQAERDFRRLLLQQIQQRQDKRPQMRERSQQRNK